MSEANKAAFKFASTHIIEIPHVDEVSDEAVMHNIKFMSHAAGAMDLLEWARSKQIYGINIDGNPTPFGTVNLSDLEAYFAEGEK